MTDLSPLWISLKIAILAVIIVFFLGIGAAYWMLGYQGRSKFLVEGIFISPLILPPTVVGFLLLMLFGHNGLIGHFTNLFNFNLVFTWYAAVITATVVAFPLMYKTTLGAFEQVDANLLQVARTLGASEARIFWSILLPLSVPGLLAGITLSFARALGEFGATLMLAGNIPGQTQTMPMAIYYAVEGGQIGDAWFWVVTIMLISFSSIFGVNIWQRRTQHRSSNINTAEVDLNKSQNSNFSGSDHLSSNSQGSLDLYVDIKKQLPEFSLSVEFRSQNHLSLGLLGASGAGKSMLLRLIAGIEKPDHGCIVLNGKVLFDSNHAINIPCRKRHIGYVVQNYALFPHLNVYQNIAFGLQGKLNSKTMKERLTRQIDGMQLAGLENRYPHQLSGGQQQRVAIARALAIEPEILLFDEPFSALDTHLRSQLEQQMIKNLSRYKGVTLFVTHNIIEAYRICEDLLVIDRGKSIAHGSKFEIFENPRTIELAKISGCKNFSPVKLINTEQIIALDWNIKLKTKETINNNCAYVGIRAHQISFTNQSKGINIYPCWLASYIEGPHQVTLLIKLNSPSENEGDFHLQVEIYKEKWNQIKGGVYPLYVYLDPKNLMLLN